MECDGLELNKGYIANVKECAAKCTGVSTMFAFGTNDFDETRCEDTGCRCLCETAATPNGTCSVVNHRGYRLYEYKVANPGNSLC